MQIISFKIGELLNNCGECHTKVTAPSAKSAASEFRRQIAAAMRNVCDQLAWPRCSSWRSRSEARCEREAMRPAARSNNAVGLTMPTRRRR